MQPDMQAKLEKIQRTSSSLRAVCRVLQVAIVLQFLAEAVMILTGRSGSIRHFVDSYNVAGMPLHSRLLLLLVCALTSAVMVKGIFHLRKLFGNYSHGEIFTRESVGQIRQLGITCLLAGGVNILWTFLRMGIGVHRPHSYPLSSDAFPLGIITMVVAWFMEMAVELREENELTI